MILVGAEGCEPADWARFTFKGEIRCTAREANHAPYLQYLTPDTHENHSSKYASHLICGIECLGTYRISPTKYPPTQKIRVNLRPYLR